MTYKISNFIWFNLTCWDWLYLCSYEYACMGHIAFIAAQEYTSTFYMNLANKVFIFECFLLQGKDILKFMTPLWRVGGHSKANEGLVEKNVSNVYCCQGGLMASVYSSGSCFPESHPQRWDMLLSKMLIEVCLLITAPARAGVRPYSGVIRPLCWQCTMDGLMPILRNPRQGDSTEKQDFFSLQLKMFVICTRFREK